MRQSTRNKLFGKNEVTVNAEFVDAEYDVTFTVVSVEADDGKWQTVIIQEWSDERDGFDVYVRTPGNSITTARTYIGLKGDAS